MTDTSWLALGQTAYFYHCNEDFPPPFTFHDTGELRVPYYDSYPF